MVALKRHQLQEQGPHIAGSRNAVVALKLEDPLPVGRLLNLKQECRGGIETAIVLGRALIERLEAGTPWWH